MDFGQLPLHRKFDATRASLRFAGRGDATRPFNLYLGAPQWTVPDWVVKIYPKGTKPAQYLHFFSRQWNTIELNTSFYNIPSTDQVRKWAEMTPPGFRFFVKIFRGISHESDAWADLRLLHARLADFVRAWTALESRLGGCFLQLPPEFGPNRLGSLGEALAPWPAEIPLAVEFRHADWFADRALIDPAREFLMRRGFGTVITDTPGRRDASHGTLTNDRLFVRFLGQSTVDHPAPLPIDFERIEAWADGIARSRAAGLSEYACFVHTPDTFWAPELADAFLARLRGRGVETQIAAPTRVPPPPPEPQLTLF